MNREPHLQDWIYESGDSGFTILAKDVAEGKFRIAIAVNVVHDKKLSYLNTSWGSVVDIGFIDDDESDRY